MILKFFSLVQRYVTEPLAFKLEFYLILPEGGSKTQPTAHYWALIPAAAGTLSGEQNPHSRAKWEGTPKPRISTLSNTWEETRGREEAEPFKDT